MAWGAGLWVGLAGWQSMGGRGTPTGGAAPGVPRADWGKSNTVGRWQGQAQHWQVALLR